MANKQQPWLKITEQPDGFLCEIWGTPQAAGVLRARVFLSKELTREEREQAINELLNEEFPKKKRRRTRPSGQARAGGQ